MNTANPFPRTAIPIAGVAFAVALSAQPATSQVTFSFDFHGPSRSVADCAGVTMTEGDILTPCPTGTPAYPVGPFPLPTPLIAIPAGPLGAGLGLAAYPACVGLPPGAPCFSPIGPTGIEVDALSYGFDGPVDANVFVPGTNLHFKARWHFSVDEFATGFPVPIPPTVFTEGGLTGDAAADVFTDIGFIVPPPLPPFATPPGNIGVMDGNGRLSIPSLFAYPGWGGIEPTAAGLPPDPGDNLDAVDMDGTSVGGTIGTFPVYFSLDSSFPDPRNGFPNSGSAIGHGFLGADVLVTAAPGGPPALFAPAAALGLNIASTFFDADDLDALILFENGSGVFEPSAFPYDWLAAGGPDMLLFSVRTGSAVIGMPSSNFGGIPIEPGDILSTPLPPALGGVSPFPSIFIACENLGLNASFARMGPVPFGDDLDAADFRRDKILLQQEYCYGDGGAIAGCTPCPCGNNVPAGNQTGCMNGAGQGARLVASGLACVSADTLRFQMTGGNPGTFAILISADNRLPLVGPCPPGAGIAQPALLDGLRCIGGNVTRNGARAMDANGDVGFTNAGWGPPNGPPGGLIAARGLVACQVRQWQVFYREDATLVCGTGINTSNAVQITITP